jgi:hypothetical protein
MDMPFLLRYSLEGLRRINTEHCRQILVIPDGWGEDGGKALREVVEAGDDPRVEYVDLPALDVYLNRRLKPPNGASTHWMMTVAGTNHARCEYAFLHDSDAFFLDNEGLERQYRECRDRGMYTLGVTARWDPFFRKLGYAIPGTWELMYSTRWACSRSPYYLKGRLLPTPDGVNEFDSMLYPQYLDYGTGKVGVMETPPRLVHFNGTIVTYRLFRDRDGGQVVDEIFRVLLLALLEEQLPGRAGIRVVPPVEELARGLNDPSAPVVYHTEAASREYPTFRRMIDELCDAPIFRGPRADRIREQIRTFDDYFSDRAVATDSAAPAARKHGLA